MSWSSQANQNEHLPALSLLLDPCCFYSQRLVALVGHVCRQRWGAGNIRLLAMFSPDGQRKDANTLSPPIDHPDILLEVRGAHHVAFRPEHGP